MREINLVGRGDPVIADAEFSRGGTKAEISFADPYLGDRNVEGKWGLQFKTGSSEDLKTLLAGFQTTFWVGVLVFPMPLLVLLLMQGAYYQSLWAADDARCRENFRRTMVACKALIVAQIVYFVSAQVPAYLYQHGSDLSKHASSLICGDDRA